MAMSTYPVTATVFTDVFTDVLSMAETPHQRPGLGHTAPAAGMALVASHESPRIAALIDAARSGDHAAFGELVVIHERVVFRTALAALGRREDAEDAAQEAFVVAWQKLNGFRGQAMFRTWLLTIVWRKALDRRRSQLLWWRRTQTGVPDDTFDPLDTLESASASPEQHAVGRDLAKRIRAAIVSLSPKLKDTFLLAMSGDHTYDEIASMLKIPLGTVKWRVSEARRVIHGQL